MILSKITAGFVIQRFDTIAGKWLDQEFVQGDQFEYENEAGEPVDYDQLCASGGKGAYLSFEMKQPSEMKDGEYSCRKPTIKT